MIETQKIFQYKKMNQEKLEDFGFAQFGEKMQITEKILDDQFEVTVIISQDNHVDYHVLDTGTNEVYTLVKNLKAHGAFIGEVRAAVELFLQEIATECFDSQLYLSPQTARIIAYIESAYDVKSEHPWEISPKNSIFRHMDNNKWFALLLPIDGKKIDAKFTGEVEILNVKGTAEDVAQLTATDKYFPGYHMNKKYWYTIVLNESLSDKEIIAKIDESFQLTL